MSEQPARKPDRVLVVDDDPAVAELVKEVVDRTGARARTCADGADALACLAREPANLVITDLVMPRGGGLEVLKAAKTANPEVLVIIMTGHGSLESAIAAIREGAYDYVRKPFKLGEMEVCVRNALERLRLVHENRVLLRQLEDTCQNLVARPATHLSEAMALRPALSSVSVERDMRAERFTRLEALAAWRKDGLLSESEFAQLKQELLDSGRSLL